jgi:hypothetical protein
MGGLRRMMIKWKKNQGLNRVAYCLGATDSHDYLKDKFRKL